MDGAELAAQSMEVIASRVKPR